MSLGSVGSISQSVMIFSISHHHLHATILVWATIISCLGSLLPFLTLMFYSTHESQRNLYYKVKSHDSFA